MRIMDEIRSQWGMKYPCEAQEEEGERVAELAGRDQVVETVEPELTEVTETEGSTEITATEGTTEITEITGIIRE